MELVSAHEQDRRLSRYRKLYFVFLVSPTFAFVWIFSGEVDITLVGFESRLTLTVVAALCVEALCIFITNAWEIFVISILSALILILNQNRGHHHVDHQQNKKARIMHKLNLKWKPVKRMMGRCRGLKWWHFTHSTHGSPCKALFVLRFHTSAVSIFITSIPHRTTISRALRFECNEKQDQLQFWWTDRQKD